MRKKRSTIYIARSLVHQSALAGSIRKLETNVLGEEDTRGVRLVYPLHDMFVFHKRDILAKFFFRDKVASGLFRMLKKYRIGIFILMFTGTMYEVSFQLGFMHFHFYPYIAANILPGLLVLLLIQLFGVSVASRLCGRVEVQFACLNVLGLVIGILVIFENKIIAICHGFLYTTACLALIFLDAAVGRDSKYLYMTYHFLTIVTLMSLWISLSRNSLEVPELKTFPVEIGSFAAGGTRVSYSWADFVTKCTSNIALLCVVRDIILWRSSGLPDIYINTSNVCIRYYS